MTTRTENIVNDEGRTCSHCKEYKRWELYSKNKNLPYQKANICKACSSQIAKEWRARQDVERLAQIKEQQANYYKGHKTRKTELDLKKYCKKHYNVTPDVVIQKKEKGCEICGTNFRVQVDKEWLGEIHAVCQLCKSTMRKYDNPEHSLQLLRSFTIQQAIRKGLH